MSWTYLWSRIKAVPAGVWAATGAGLTLLFLYWRGRRLEAELAQAQLRVQGAKAAAKSARSEGRAQLHMERADEHSAKVTELEKAADKIDRFGKTEARRIAALPAAKITEEYLHLARQEWDKKAKSVRRSKPKPRRHPLGKK